MNNTAVARIRYLDLLRVVGCLSVIMLHTAASNFSRQKIDSYAYAVFNFYDCISRWGVPVFLMITGVLFLNNDVSIKMMYKKYIRRIFLVLAIWSFVYALWDYAMGVRNYPLVLAAVIGKYHLWYLWMCIGIYMVMPILKKIIVERQIVQYFLLLAFILSFVIPQVAFIVNPISEKWNNWIWLIPNKLSIHMVLGYIGFVLLGYYLDREWNNIPNKMNMGAFLGGLGCAVTVIGNWIFVHFVGKHTVSFMDYFTVNVLLESIGGYMLVRIVAERIHNEKFWRIVCDLSGLTMGAYLVHVMVLEGLKHVGIDTMSLNPAIGTIGIFVLVSVISFAVAWMLAKSPLRNIV